MATKKKKPTSLKVKGPKKVCQNKDCIYLGKHQSLDEFYESRNASIGYHPWCKDCLHKSIDINNMDTVYDVLKVLDIPFVAGIWQEMLNKYDSNYFEEYYKSINRRSRYAEARWKNSIFEDNTDDIQEEEEPIASFPEADKSADIPAWDEEWQGNYTDKELKYLNDYYRDLQNDFKIVTRNHRDYAHKIAQASLAMNTAFSAMRNHPQDKDMVNAYRAATTNFDMLSKSAQFAESQRGANDVSLGCFGKVFDAVEKHNWVPQHIPDNKDMFDKILDQFSNIRRSL